MKSLVTSFCLSLCFLPPKETSRRKIGPRCRPQIDNRLPRKNAANLELLATWRTGRVEGVTWLTEDRLAIQESQHTIVYQLSNLDEPQAVIPASGHALSSPDWKLARFYRKPV